MCHYHEEMAKKMEKKSPTAVTCEPIKYLSVNLIFDKSKLTENIHLPQYITQDTAQ